MAKFLFRGRYTNEGLKGLQQEGGTRRRESVVNLFASLGGRLEAMYFALGEDDVIVIAELPDNAAAAAGAIAVGAAGMIGIETVALLSPEEIDAAVKHKINFRPPSRS